MVKWLVTLFLALVILAMVMPWFGRIALGRLPGDFRIPLRGRIYYVPLASTVLLSLLVWGIRRLLLAHGGLRHLECPDERARARQRIAEIGFAEVREVAARLAAEGGPVRGRGGDHDAVVVAQRLDEAAGIAGRDHDHAPLDARVLQHAAEGGRRERGEIERRLHRREPVVAIAVRGEEEKHHVLVAVHLLADARKSARQV